MIVCHACAYHTHSNNALKYNAFSQSNLMQQSPTSSLSLQEPDFADFPSSARSSVTVRSNHNLSMRSSFHENKQHELTSYLTNSLQLPHRAAYLLIAMHKCLTLAEALDLMLKDEDGKNGHIFISKKGTHVCQICDEGRQMHKFIDDSAVQTAEEQYAQFTQFHGTDHIGRVPDFFNGELQAEPSTGITCEICYMSLKKEEMRSQTHPVCLACMFAYVKEQVSNMRVQNLGCPHCGEKLAIEEIKQLSDKATFNKYQMFMRNAEIRKNPNLKWCPNPKCSIVVLTLPKKGKAKCPKCNTEICLKCNREAHPSKSCNQVFNAQIKTWQNSSDIQKCKKCHGLVQKISGCNHMTCGVCGHEWCWLCGGRYSQAHFSPLNPFGCPGLQDRGRDEWGKGRIVACRVLMFIGIVAALPIALPLAMLIAGPAIIGNFLWRECYPYSCLARFLLIIMSTILGIILNPFVWIGIVAYYLPKGVIYIIDYFRRRRQIDQHSDALLQQKLLKQASEVVYEEEVMQ